MVMLMVKYYQFFIQPNLVLKWDNAPAVYGAIFDGSEVCLRFYFAEGRYPLALVVRVFCEGELK